VCDVTGTIVMGPKARLGFSGKSYFVYNGTRYRWKGTVKKFKMTDEAGDLLAEFKRTCFSYGKDGQMEIFKCGDGMQDVIVMTFLMYLYRKHSEERFFRSLGAGG
jgi:hypothetical protein